MEKSGKELVQKVFSENKKAYVKSKTHAKGVDLMAIPHWLNLNVEDKLLDVATGGGHVAKIVSPYVKQVFAVDLTKDMLEEAAKHLKSLSNIHYIVADAESLPFLNNTFDHVVCRIAAHHFTSPYQFLKEVSRVLKPGGSFLLIDNIAPENASLDSFINSLEKLRDSSHNRSLKKSEWAHFLQEVQFTIMKEKERKKTLPFQDWLSRTLSDKTMQEQVYNFVLGADKAILKHYQVDHTRGKIDSIGLDEWMVLCEKL
ncbi:class I SAM-dependent methyltransferase [Oceanobacillus kapialis]|uniref:Class I SAM-dependent methyltransferase n=1 Tax=Oceanobacillus kapialis TaxID=481353 RepID=A0ABW5PZ63_9BACI